VLLGGASRLRLRAAADFQAIKEDVLRDFAEAIA